MGSSAIRTMSIAIALMGITVFYCAPNAFDCVISLIPLVGIPEESVKDFLAKYHKNYVVEQDDQPTKINSEGVRLYTKEYLAKCNGESNKHGLYLAILGEVFDVAKGAQHYKPGSSYAFFAGRDASRAYITGEFVESDDVDDVSDLDESSMVSLNDWLTFYREEYAFMGKLIGRYYDEEGKPTEFLKQVLEKIKAGQANKWLEDHEKNVFPPCNSEWSKEKGSRVWCTNKSGGVDRKWVGVPRKLYKPGKDPRCVCVRDTGPPSDQPDLEKHHNVGDLEHPHLHQYPDCPVRSSSCQVDHP